MTTYKNLLGSTENWRLYIPFTPLENKKCLLRQPYDRDYVLTQLPALNKVLSDKLKLFILNSSVIDADGIYLEYRLKDTVREYAIEWKSDHLSDSEAVAKDTYKYAEEVFNMLKRHGEYLAFQPLMLMCETVPNSSGGTEHLKRFKVA